MNLHELYFSNVQVRIRTRDLSAKFVNALSTELPWTNLGGHTIHPETLLIMTSSLIFESAQQEVELIQSRCGFYIQTLINSSENKNSISILVK